MNNLYDNGTILIGTIKDVKKYMEKQLQQNDDAYVDDIKDILEDIKDLDDNSIISINYDWGMGYIMNYWNDDDIVKRGEENG